MDQLTSTEHDRKDCSAACLRTRVFIHKRSFNQMDLLSTADLWLSDCCPIEILTETRSQTTTDDTSKRRIGTSFSVGIPRARRPRWCLSGRETVQKGNLPKIETRQTRFWLYIAIDTCALSRRISETRRSSPSRLCLSHLRRFASGWLASKSRGIA